MTDRPECPWCEAQKCQECGVEGERIGSSHLCRRCRDRWEELDDDDL